MSENEILAIFGVSREEIEMLGHGYQEASRQARWEYEQMGQILQDRAHQFAQEHGLTLHIEDLRNRRSDG